MEWGVRSEKERNWEGSYSNLCSETLALYVVWFLKYVIIHSGGFSQVFWAMTMLGTVTRTDNKKTTRRCK